VYDSGRDALYQLGQVKGRAAARGEVIEVSEAECDDADFRMGFEDAYGDATDHRGSSPLTDLCADKHSDA